MDRSLGDLHIGFAFAATDDTNTTGFTRGRSVFFRCLAGIEEHLTQFGFQLLLFRFVHLSFISEKWFENARTASNNGACRLKIHRTSRASLRPPWPVRKCMLKIPHCAGMIDWGSWRPTPEITVGMALYQFIGICKPKSAHEVEKWRILLYCLY